MEIQLEEEYDDKQKVLRERRDLESKLLNAQDQVQPTTRLITNQSIALSGHVITHKPIMRSCKLQHHSNINILHLTHIMTVINHKII